MSKSVILDASALIAFIYQEKGMEVVEEYLPHSKISTINLTETATFMIKQGLHAKEVNESLKDLSLTIIHFDESQAFLAARLVEKTANSGLSLGDRACLALGIQENLPVLTADKIWTSLSLNIKIKLIR